ncbi:glycosyltransferase [Streptomyces californicus]
MIAPASGEGEHVAVGSAAVEAHSDIPSGEAGRVLRIADARPTRGGPPPWTASR